MYAIFKKDFLAYFKTNFAYFVLFVYACLSALNMIYVGKYFELSNINLYSLFSVQPHLLALVLPAISMKSWSEEYKQKTIDIILTQPLSYSKLVWAKFLATFAMASIMILFTLPIWIYTASITTLDNLNILGAYATLFMVAGVFSALGNAVSAFNKNPLMAYLMAFFISWILIELNFAKFKPLSEVLSLQNVMEKMSFMPQYNNIISGQISLSTMLYFVLIVLFCGWINVVALEYKKD